MANETNEFGKNVGESTISSSEEVLLNKLLEKGAKLKFTGYSESFKLNSEVAFKNLQKGRAFKKIGEVFETRIISKLMLFSNIKSDYNKTKNLVYSTAKNVTSSVLGKLAGTAATAAIAVPTGGTDAPLAIAGGIATDAALETGVNNAFEYGYQNRGKLSKAWQKFLNNAKNSENSRFTKLEPAKYDTSNQPVAGVATSTVATDNTRVVVTYPKEEVSSDSSFLSTLGNLLSGAANLISNVVGIATMARMGGNKGVPTGVEPQVQNYSKDVKGVILSMHTGGIVVPKYKGGRNEMLAILQGGETVRTEAQEKELQDAKLKEFLEAYAPLVSGENKENDPYAQVFGNNKTNTKDIKTPVLANKTTHDEETIIAIVADAWKSNRSGFRNILRYS